MGTIAVCSLCHTADTGVTGVTVCVVPDASVPLDAPLWTRHTMPLCSACLGRPSSGAKVLAHAVVLELERLLDEW